jgi:uncharacterized protein
MGASWATRLKSETLYKIIAVLLVAIVLVLLAHGTTVGAGLLSGTAQVVAGVIAGFVIGVIASIAGGRWGRVLDPDARVAVRSGHQAGGQSVPSCESSDHARWVRPLQPRSKFQRDPQQHDVHAPDGCGINPRTFIGGLLVGVVPTTFLLPALAALLILSAIKVWMHE